MARPQRCRGTCCTVAVHRHCSTLHRALFALQSDATNESDREVEYDRKWDSVLAVSAHCNHALKNPAVKREIEHFTPHSNHASNKAQSSEERAESVLHQMSLGGAGRKRYFLCRSKPTVWCSKEHPLQPQSGHADTPEIT